VQGHTGPARWSEPAPSHPLGADRDQAACRAEHRRHAAFIAKALGDIARAKGMTQVARDAGLSRESLYKALSGARSPDFDTILRVVGALGLQSHAGAMSRSPAGAVARGGSRSDPG
jgi:probable addiction module antidote protein